MFFDLDVFEGMIVAILLTTQTCFLTNYFTADHVDQAPSAPIVATLQLFE